MDHRIKFERDKNGVHLRTANGIEINITGRTAIAICGTVLLLGATIFLSFR